MQKMNVQMNEWMADADRQYKKKRRTDMQETWLEQFYNEMDAEKRLDILNTNADKTVNASEWQIIPQKIRKKWMWRL